MENLLIKETDKKLAEVINNTNIDDQVVVLFTQNNSNEDEIKSIIMHNAGMENLSDPNWADIANSINDLANRNILMANINDMNLKSIVSKLKDNNIKVKSVLVDNIEELKSSKDYAELESFLIASGANIIACS
ncbi:MAG: hypothetical protein IJ681_03855 [Bacteroidales bacterium]|nr:hypothetical protein [Bacteroidales bacterium]